MEIDLSKLYIPQPKQVLFHRCPADRVLYGGGRGGGKSEALLWDAITQCLTYKGYVAVIFRRIYDNLMGVFRERLYKLPNSIGTWNQTERSFRFVNGSVILLRAADEPKDAEGFQGNEWDGLYIDEIQEFTQNMITPLLMNLRGSGKVQEQITPRFRASAWPWGIGHAWVKKEWITPAPPYTIWSPNTDEEGHLLPEGETRPTRCFIPANIFDNPALLKRYPGYINELKDKPEAERRAAFGDWDVYEGQAFPEWRKERHVVTPFPLPSNWIKRGGVDFGTTAPWAAYFYAEDPSVIDEVDPTLRRVYVFAEFYERGTDAQIQAKKLQLFCSNQSNMYAIQIPPDMNMKGSTNRNVSPADVYRRYLTPLGVAIQVASRAGKNHRAHRKDLMHRFLSLAPDGKPWLQVFDTCRQLTSQLPSLPIDPNRPDDVDTRAEDHAYDALTHALDVRNTTRISGRDVPYHMR